MIVFESRHSRRFVGRVERGEDLVATLKRFAQSERIRAAWVRATGLLEWVELTDWDASKEALRAPRHIEGPLALVACEGNVSFRLGEPYVELRGAFSREGELGLQSLGGQLVVAAALNVELVIDVFEDVRLERDEERETGLSVWKGERTPGVMARSTKRDERPARATSSHATGAGPTLGSRGGASASASSMSASMSASVSTRAPDAELPEVEVDVDEPDEDTTRAVDLTGSGVSWAQVAKASEQAERVPARPDVAQRRVAPGLLPSFDKPAEKAVAHDDGTEPRKGDWIDHRQFGLCRVDGEDPSGGLVIRLPSGIRKVIHTEMLDVLPPRFEGDRRIFPLRPRKK